MYIEISTEYQYVLNSRDWVTNVHIALIFLPNGNIYLAINSGAISEIVSTEWLDFSLVGSRAIARREPPAVKEV